ncbi:MAG: MATE family efflux transporter [Marinifilaceae bacterium]
MNKKILNIAIPNIISNVTIPLLGLVDLALMGHLGKEDFIGAIALGGMIFNFLYWGFAFLRMGTSGFAAQAYGARDLKESTLTLSRALLVALGGSLLLILLQKPIELLSFYLIQGDQEVENLARGYYYVRIWAAPATISLYALTGWYIGMQNARIPMVVAITSNILNILLSTLFVYGFHMEAKGVALGTVLAQYGALLLALYFLRAHYWKLIRHWSTKGMLQITALKKFFQVNRDIFIRTLCLIFVFTFFTSESANTNKTILAVNSLLLQFLMLFSYLMDGFAYAAEALVGKYVGSQNREDLKRLIQHLFKWGIGISACFTLLYGTSGNEILSLLTSNSKVLNAATPFMIWVILLPFLSFASFLYDGIYIGATSSVYMRKTMMISTLLIFIPVYFTLGKIWSNHGLWIAMLGFMLSRGVFQAIYYKKAVLNLIPQKSN